MDQRIVLYLAGVLCLGILAQWIAWRLRLPSILLLLLLGLAAGYYANPDDLFPREVLFAIVSLSVAVILFEGGLTLRLSELRDAGRAAVLRLVTVGVAVTWVLSAAACWLLLDFDLPLAVLAGAIFTVSGPTVIGPLLHHVRPKGRVGPVAKWEGIVNDPIGAVLAVLVFEAIRDGDGGDAGLGAAATGALGGLLLTATVGGLLGAVVALILVQSLKRFWIPDYLHSVCFLAAVLVTFVAANSLQHESGLVAVTVLGACLGNQRSVTLRHVAEFKENLQVLLISCLFIVLGSRLQFSDLIGLGVAGLLFLAGLLLVVRPTAVFLSTLGTELTLREKLFLCCMAPRGIVAVAVASVFALALAGQAAGANRAEQLVHLTFLVILGTVGVYGLLAAPAARWLGLAEPDAQGVLFAGASAWIRDLAAVLAESGFAVLMVDMNHRNVTAARLAGLPAEPANILSEYVQEEIDLSGIGRLLAMTPNDEINSLATLEFGHTFGRAGVYQLPPEPAGTERTEPAGHMRGRLLFEGGATYAALSRRYAAGQRFKKTALSDEFTYEDYLRKHGGDPLVLFRITESGKLLVRTADEELDPKAGDTLVALVKEKPPKKPNERPGDGTSAATA